MMNNFNKFRTELQNKITELESNADALRGHGISLLSRTLELFTQLVRY